MPETPVPRVAKGAPTLHDVAREAGVSLATASRVLNGSTRRVADSYRERVAEAAERLGYTANLSAQATARGTAPIVALLVADIADPYFAQIASGVARRADQAGLIVTIAITERDPARELKLMRALRGQRPRGIILAASRAVGGDPAALVAEVDALGASGGRVVTIGGGPDGGTLDGTRSVAVDNRGGSRALGARLTELGYREAVIVAGAEGLRTSDLRVAGFTEGFGSGGGRVIRVLRGAMSRDEGYRLTSELLRDERVAPGTVVFGVSDVVAFGALSAIRGAGREPGADVAVAGFDDIDAGRDIVPGLTTVRVPLEDLGALALGAAIAADWEPGPPLPAEVIVRASTPAR